MPFTIAVVLPAYNEAANIGQVVEKTVQHLKALPVVSNFKVVVVNDGSKDETPCLVDALAEQHPEHVVAVHQPNGGYGKALRRGFVEAAKTDMDWIFFMDSDQQFDIAEIEKLFTLVDQGADFAAGYRVNRADPFMRKLNGWGWTLACSVVMGWPVRDVDCAFKLFHRTLLGDPHTLQGEGATINPALFMRARHRKAKILQTGVSHYPRQHGTQTGANLKVILRSFHSLIQVRLAAPA